MGFPTNFSKTTNVSGESVGATFGVFFLLRIAEIIIERKKWDEQCCSLVVLFHPGRGGGAVSALRWFLIAAHEPFGVRI